MTHLRPPTTSTSIDQAAEHDYNIGLTIPNVPQILARWTERSAEARTQIGTKHRTVSYGCSEREVVDIFTPSNPTGRVVVYWHGGFFRRVSKDDNTFVVPAFLNTGDIVVMGEYPLAPGCPVPEILQRTRSAHRWIHDHIANFGGDPKNMIGVGHSVGATILADAMSSDDLPVNLFSGCVFVSGVLDMRPIRRTSLNADLQMSAADAERASPSLRRNMSPEVPIRYVFGTEETAGFKSQTRLMHNNRKGGVHSWRGHIEEIPGANHLTILDRLFTGPSPLWRRAIHPLFLR